MATQKTITIPDGKSVPIIPMVDSDKAELTIAALASYSTLQPTPILDEDKNPVLDEDKKPTFDTPTLEQKAVDYLSKHVGMVVERFQSKQSVLADQGNHKTVTVESLE